MYSCFPKVTTGNESFGVVQLLQHDSDEPFVWLVKSSLRVNIGKCLVVAIDRDNLVKANTIGGSPLMVAAICKYLGVLV